MTKSFTRQGLLDKMSVLSFKSYLTVAEKQLGYRLYIYEIVESQHSCRIYLFSYASRPALEPT
jgi:hypothetical protein